MPPESRPSATVRTSAIADSGALHREARASPPIREARRGPVQGGIEAPTGSSVVRSDRSTVRLDHTRPSIVFLMRSTLSVPLRISRKISAHKIPFATNDIRSINLLNRADFFATANFDLRS